MDVSQARDNVAAALADVLNPTHKKDPAARFSSSRFIFFFFQAEDGIRDTSVTGVQTCALPILVRALIDLLLAHRPVVAWLTRDLAALAQPGIGARVAANTERLQRLLAGADPGGVGQVRAAAAVGALTRPVAVLEDLDLGDLSGTILAAALGALGRE